jgi:hypothetical protein
MRLTSAFPDADPGSSSRCATKVAALAGVMRSAMRRGSRSSCNASRCRSTSRYFMSSTTTAHSDRKEMK